jgi:hypothetical protein
MDNVVNQKSTVQDINDFDTYGKLEIQHPLINCTYVNDTYSAGSVWNTGKMVALFSESSFSAANVLRFLLIGDNEDGVISTNMDLKVLGCFKGTYHGAFLGNVFLPNNTLGNLDDTILYTSFGGECPAQNEYNINTDLELKPLNHLLDTTDISSSSSPIKSISGSSFVSGLESLIYPDFGFSQNMRAVIPGDSRPQQPDPSNFTSYRYAYLESAILELKLSW